MEVSIYHRTWDVDYIFDYTESDGLILKHDIWEKVHESAALKLPNLEIMTLQ